MLSKWVRGGEDGWEKKKRKDGKRHCEKGQGRRERKKGEDSGLKRSLTTIRRMPWDVGIWEAGSQGDTGQNVKRGEDV